MAFKYQIGELNLLSELQIPMLREVEFDKSDLNVYLRKISQVPQNTIEIQNNSILYKDIYKNVFLISDKEIHISINNQENTKEAATTVMGIPMGYLLQINGFQVLHGSSVSINNLAVSFIGRSGAGKSSIALALINDGLRLLTEDLCIIKNKEIYNFSNWIKSNELLTPEKLAYSDQIEIKNDSRNRSLFKLDSGHISKSKSKLKVIYFLDQASDAEIIELKPLDAFRHLFTFAYRIGEKDKNSFNNLTELCKDTKCYLFRRDIKKSLEENKNFLYNHLNQALLYEQHPFKK